MKIQSLIFAIILLTLLNACSDSKETNQQAAETDSQKSHLKDISNDTITVSGKVINAEDIGWAYTYGLNVDTGSDRLSFNSFTMEYNENSLLNKQVNIRYYNVIKYDEIHPSVQQKDDHKITGTYNILDYGGDLPGAYSITDKNGKSVEIEAFLYEEDNAFEGKEITLYYRESYEIRIVSLVVEE